jgi:hypothetical protein
MYQLDESIAAIITREVKIDMMFLVEMGLPVNLALQEGWHLACSLVADHWTEGNAFARQAQVRVIFKHAVLWFKQELPPSSELL